MQALTFDDWPFAVRYLVVAAQNRANAREHAMTSGAHVTSVLLDMPFVAAAIAEADPKAKDVASRALMTEAKSAARKALLAAPLHAILTATGPGRAERSTAAFLRGAPGAHPVTQKIAPLFAARADAFAAKLDEPRLERWITKPLGLDKECAVIAIGFDLASRLSHAEMASRHVLLAALRTLDGILGKRGLPRMGDELERLAELVGRSAGLRAGTTLWFQPRLVGIIADKLASGGPTTLPAMAAACFEGDPDVAFAAEAYDRALAAIKAAQASAPPGDA